MKQLQIPNRILQKTTLLNKDILSTKYQFEKTGSNGFIVIDPAVISFQGFEVNKVNIVKFKIKNCSNIAQRINILPPSSQNFSVKFEKRGSMAPGMFQEIQVIFKPESFQYYYDTIKIHTESDNLVVPIHAYPVIQNLREVFPRLIDFGCIDIDSEKSFNFPIVNKIPVDFEFEFNFTQIPQDITVSPERGLIPKNSTTIIKFTFCPRQNITYSYQTELKVSQFDFDPLPIKIMGTGRSTRLKQSAPQKRPQSGTLASLGKHTNPDEINVETLVNEVDISQIEHDFKEKKRVFVKKTTTFSTNTITDHTDRKQIQPKKQTFFVEKDEKRIQLEQTFLEKFKTIQQTEKDKDISLLKNMEKESVTRYQLLAQRDVPIIDEARLNLEPTWDTFKNNDIKKRKQIINEFLRVATILITRNRVQKRLMKIKAFLKDCKNRAQVKKLVQDDWLQAEYRGIGKKDFSPFSFDIDEHYFHKQQLPIQFDVSNSISNFKFLIDTTTGFDEQLPIELINYCDSEVMGYKNWQVNPLLIYNPIESDRKMRTGAEEEYSNREQSGPLEEEKDLQLLYLQEPIAEFKKPYDSNCHALITLDPNLKAYHSSEPKTETSPEFNLIYKKIAYQDQLDPQPNQDIGLPLFKQLFLQAQPGLNPLLPSNLEMDYYYFPRLQLQADFGFQKNINMCCPDTLESVQKEDMFTDEDSDGEKPPQLEYEEAENWLKNLEGADTVIKEARDRQVFSQKEFIEEKINSNLLQEKVQSLYLMPTRTQEYNKMIRNPELKLLII